MEIHWNGARLFYKKAGSGPNLLLFHGFGQDHSAFDPLVSTITDHYTCYSFDLFFHGSSSWANTNEPVTFHAWNQILDIFIRQENITHFSVLGFSIGARLALAAFTARPELTRQLILVAPDGIREHRLFSLATAFSVNRLAFKWIAKSDHIFPALITLTKRMRLLHPALIRFAQAQMRTKEARIKVYNTWIAFRNLKFKERELAVMLHQHRVRAIILLASNDQVINEKRLKKFISLLDQPIVKTLEARHSHILLSLARVFRSVVTDQNETLQ